MQRAQLAGFLAPARMTGAGCSRFPAIPPPLKSNRRHCAAYFIGDKLCLVSFVANFSGELRLPTAGALRGLKSRASFCPPAICSGVIFFSNPALSFLDVLRTTWLPRWRSTKNPSRFKAFAASVPDTMGSLTLC